MGKVEDIARRYFPKDFTDRERAIFEAGIALGALTHSAVGLPRRVNRRALYRESAGEELHASALP
jgi:hypothetical protein